MKIALAQINPTVGDLAGNCEKIVRFHEKAVEAGAELVVFPELAVTGYPPLDLIVHDGFLASCAASLQALAERLEGIPALVGCVMPNLAPGGRPALNAAVLLSGGKLSATRAKSRLPTYDVFDEDRYFEPATARKPVELGAHRLGITVCEDIWDGPEDDRPRYQVDPVADLVGQGANLLVNLSASPFFEGKAKLREERLRSIARTHGIPAVLVNQVGGNDSLLFDGRSFAVGGDGRVLARAEAFREDLVMVDLQAQSGDVRPSPAEGPAELFGAIVMGLRDYMNKCGFECTVLGLSGGIDSAVTAVLAAEAAGAERVYALAMPSRYSSPHSRRDAELMCRNLGMRFFDLPIGKVLDAYRETLRADLDDVTGTLTEENLQARIRGALVMAFANNKGALALATGNKSELAVGYCTLYGDMVGGLAPIGDLLKSQVYELARYINRQAEVIPNRIIERPPSAELRPDQKDTDSLPPYELLDPILELYITAGLGAEAIVAKGYPREMVTKVIRLVESSEFKRRQAAPVLKVTRRSFGSGRRVPIARGLRRS